MSRLPYWTCPDCGSHIGHGESCDCKKKTLKVSESFIVGVDISAGNDTSCVTVTKQNKSKFEVINTIYGKEAENMYQQMTGAQTVAK